jgi:hypothetical protein
LARIYVETTIASFYFEVRSEPEMIARKNWTREWFDEAIQTEELVTSAAVLQELQGGNFPGKADAIQWILALAPLAINDRVLEIVDEYIIRRLMPLDPAGDALHLALASHHACDFLVTWNCRHLANANKFGHIRQVNGILGLPIPTLVTPLELLGKNP